MNKWEKSKGVDSSNL